MNIAATDRDGLFLAADESYDSLIVDLISYELDRLPIVKILRGARIQTRVLFLTALSAVGNRLTGLDAGGEARRS